MREKTLQHFEFCFVRKAVARSGGGVWCTIRAGVNGVCSILLYLMLMNNYLDISSLSADIRISVGIVNKMSESPRLSDCFP